MAENEKLASLYEKEQNLKKKYVELYPEKKKESQQDKKKILSLINI